MDCLSSHCDLTLYNFVRERRLEASEEEIRPKSLLSGRDLIAMGYQPGPALPRNSFRDRRRAIGRIAAHP